MLKRRALFIGMVWWILLPLLPACSEAARHRILCFFFDGVPEPGERRSELGPEAGGLKIPAGRREGGRAERPGRRVYAHAPYARNHCRGCHDPGSGLLYRTVGEGLCQSCHKDVPGAVAQVHGPVAVNACSACHHHHASPYPKLLLDEVTALCLQCHEKADLAGGTHHAGIDQSECTECHDPHGGNERFLLRQSER